MQALGYNYDELGNIKTVSAGGLLKQSYVYDGHVIRQIILYLIRHIKIGYF